MQVRERVLAVTMFSRKGCFPMLARRNVWCVAMVAAGLWMVGCGGDDPAAPGDDDISASSSGNGGSSGRGGSSGQGGSSSGNGGSSGQGGSSSGNGGSSGQGGSSGGGSSSGDGGVIVGPSATISGTVYAPNSVTPLAGVTVSWSATAPAPIEVAASCSVCAGPPAGAVVSGANGSFQITVPANQDIFLTTQFGKFRRVRAARFVETDTTVAALVTTLPGRTEGTDTIPRIGILPGSFDDIQAELQQFGVQDFTSLTDSVLTNANELARYQLLLLPSGGACGTTLAQDVNVQNTLRSYVAQGGVLYTSDFRYEYFNRTFPNFVRFEGDGTPGNACALSYEPDGRHDDPRLAAYAPVGADGFQDVFVRIDGTTTQQGPGRDGQQTALSPKVWTTFVPTADLSNEGLPRPGAVSIPWGCGQAFYSTYPSTEIGSSAPLDQGNALAYALFLMHDGCAPVAAPNCIGAVGSECAPGVTSAPAACGYCGTSVSTCSNECRWMEGACDNEQAAAARCFAGTTDVRDEGCASGLYRTWTCQDGAPPAPTRCTWQAPPPATCAPPVLPFVNAGAAGTTTNFTLTANQQPLRAVPSTAFSCPADSTIERVAGVVEVRNTTAAPITVQLRLPDDGVDRVLRTYAAAAPLGTENTKACTATNDTCGDPTYESCLSNVTIPANGKVWALVGHYYESDDIPADVVLQVVR